MPELPDLQVIRSNLSKRYAGKTLKSLIIFKDQKLNASKEQFKQAFEGSTLSDISREGKELHLKFSNDNVLGLHLMLKGELYPIGESEVREGELFSSASREIKYKIIELIFHDGLGFALTDVMAQAKAILNPVTPSIPDALSNTLNVDYFLRQIEANSSTKIKTFLINQEIVRGIGNAYADEILWDCKISPFSICSKIPFDKVSELVFSINKVLIDAEEQIRKIEPNIISGEMRDFLAVHTTSRPLTPEGEEIIVGELNNKKTYFTDSQVLYQ